MLCPASIRVISLVAGSQKLSSHIYPAQTTVRCLGVLSLPTFPYAIFFPFASWVGAASVSGVSRLLYLSCSGTKEVSHQSAISAKPSLNHTTQSRIPPSSIVALVSY